jgi:hypothetical protein
MLIPFFDIDSLVHHEFIPHGLSVTGHFYVQVLQKLLNAVRTKQRDILQIACCAAIPCRGKHSCHHPTSVLSGSSPERLLAVPYSENGSQGDMFHNHGGHKSNVMAKLWKIPKEAFHWCFQQREDQWSRCVCAQVSYFEGD